MRKLAATLAVVVALMFCAGSAWADYADGKAAFDRGDYATAFQEYLPLAEEGNWEAQYELGIMYYSGYGVPKNRAEAVKWYRKAAEQGHQYAQVSLGICYDRGTGVPKDPVQAYMWFLLAAASGDELGWVNMNVSKNQLTPAQITEGEGLADRWFEEKTGDKLPRQIIEWLEKNTPYVNEWED
jgi:TPR repeat protein